MLTSVKQGVIVGTYTGTHTIAGPIIQAFLLDLGIQTTQIANRTAIYAIEPKARNRVNTAFMVSVFVGQLVGTAVGNRLYAVGSGSYEGGGWIASGSCSVGFIGLALILCFVRGPGEKGWVGWRGGWPSVRRVVEDKGELREGQQVEHGALEESGHADVENEAGIGEKDTEDVAGRREGRGFEPHSEKQ